MLLLVVLGRAKIDPGIAAGTFFSFAVSLGCLTGRCLLRGAESSQSKQRNGDQKKLAHDMAILDASVLNPTTQDYGHPDFPTKTPAPSSPIRVFGFRY